MSVGVEPVYTRHLSNGYKNSVTAERKREYIRERRKDPAFLEHQRKHRREYMRERRKDPAYLERQRKRRREYMRALRKDPMYTMRQNQLQRERYQNDPVFAERLREGQRKRRRESRRKHC
ncbi:hypothetical protein ACTL6P_23960 [Endozoicomonas acroporae]|nr:hypothetical protein [Endozoicomonas acroporae]